MSNDIPELSEWMALPLEELAAFVLKRRLSIKLSLDGSTRHYLLHHPNDDGAVTDWPHYANVTMDGLLRLADLLFSCGMETVMILNFWPGDADRRTNHVKRTVQGSRYHLLGPAAMPVYRKWGARVRMYGNWDIHPVFADDIDAMHELEAALEAATPAGERLLLWGNYAGEGIDEVVARSITLYQKLGRLPTQAEVRQACFPYGPENLDIYLGMGWLRISNVDIPPALNTNDTDFYSLAHLSLDLNENVVRRILYDKLFRRYVSTQLSVFKYTPDVLEALRAYYDEHRDYVLGTGHLVSSIGIWQPDVVPPPQFDKVDAEQPEGAIRL